MQIRHVAAGAIAGLAGTWAMSEAQRAWTVTAGDGVPQSAGGKHDAREWQERDEGRNANEMVAQEAALFIRGRRLTSSELGIAAPAVHYTFGTMLGALYGAARGDAPHSAAAAFAFGFLVWAIADEIAMPLLGLSRTPQERRAQDHLHSLAAHLVFGAATEQMRTAIATGHQ